MKPASQHPELAASILASLEAIGYPHFKQMQLGMQRYPNYDLDFAQEKLDEYTRLKLAALDKGKAITNDPAKRSDDEYYFYFAKWAGIHHNWPAVLFKPHEFEAWKAYYHSLINTCNQAGYYVRDTTDGAMFNQIPPNIRNLFGYGKDFGEVNVAMLIKYRWYRFTQSKFHKQVRLEQTEEEFKLAIQSTHETILPVQS